MKLKLNMSSKNNMLIILLFIIVVICVLFSQKYYIIGRETFQKFTTDNSYGNYPNEEDKLLLDNTYPVDINKDIKGITNNSSISLMNYRPIYEVGNYAQFTNNLKYPNNPDNGTCTPASLCGVYGDRCNGSNIITPLPPIELNPQNNVRIGYFLA